MALLLHFHIYNSNNNSHNNNNIIHVNYSIIVPESMPPSVKALENECIFIAMNIKVQYAFNND